MGVIKGDTRSLDSSSCVHVFVVFLLGGGFAVQDSKGLGFGRVKYF